jgi:hypothetical protein
MAVIPLTEVFANLVPKFKRGRGARCTERSKSAVLNEYGIVDALNCWRSLTPSRAERKLGENVPPVLASRHLDALAASAIVEPVMSRAEQRCFICPPAPSGCWVGAR